MLLLGTYPHKYSRAGKGCREPLLCPGEEAALPLAQGGDVARCDPFTTTTWVTLGMERMGGTRQPFMFFSGLGCSRPRAAAGSNPSPGLRSALFHCRPALGTAQDCLAGIC